MMDKNLKNRLIKRLLIRDWKPFSSWSARTFEWFKPCFELINYPSFFSHLMKYKQVVKGKSRIILDWTKKYIKGQFLK
jgi:hypothetical protein